MNLSEYPLQFLLPKKTPLIWFTVCRVGRNVPEYFAVLREGGEAPKVVVYFRIRKLLSILEYSGKEIQISLLRRLGSELRPLTFI